MNGWRYDWLLQLPRDVYDVLVAMLNREHGGGDPDDPETWLAQLEQEEDH